MADVRAVARHLHLQVGQQCLESIFVRFNAVANVTTDVPAYTTAM